MNVAGGVGGQVGDLPVYISAIRAESAVARSGKIQVIESSERKHKLSNYLHELVHSVV